MKESATQYFQFKKELNYQVFLRLEDEQLIKSLSPLFDEMGFSALEEKEWKQIALVQGQTRVLKISQASCSVARQICQGTSKLAYYAPESLSSHAGHDVYRYHGVGMMVLGLEQHGHGASAWELGLVDPHNQLLQLRVILTRYLAWSLAPSGVIALWAAPVEEGMVVLKPDQADFESVFLDTKQMKLITRDGIRSLDHRMQILRLDETLRDRTRNMSPEELYSFLGANTAYFSLTGLPPALKRSLYSLATMLLGVVYPMENFRSRNGVRVEASKSSAT